MRTWQGAITQLSEQISSLNERMDDFTNHIEELDSKLSMKKCQQNMHLQAQDCNGSAPTSYFNTSLGDGSLSSSQSTKESPLMDEVVFLILISCLTFSALISWVVKVGWFPLYEMCPVLWSMDTPTWWCLRMSGTSGTPMRVGHQYDTSLTYGLMCDISHLKNIIFRLGHTSDTPGHDSDTSWTRLRHTSDMAQTRVRCGWTRLEHDLVLFFPIIWWIKQEFKGPKTQFHF